MPRSVRSSPLSTFGSNRTVRREDLLSLTCQRACDSTSGLPKDSLRDLGAIEALWFAPHTAGASKREHAHTCASAQLYCNAGEPCDQRGKSLTPQQLYEFDEPYGQAHGRAFRIIDWSAIVCPIVAPSPKVDQNTTRLWVYWRPLGHPPQRSFAELSKSL
jgi:hypothetical protein